MYHALPVTAPRYTAVQDLIWRWVCSAAVLGVVTQGRRCCWRPRPRLSPHHVSRACYWRGVGVGAPAPPGSAGHPRPGRVVRQGRDGGACPVLPRDGARSRRIPGLGTPCWLLSAVEERQRQLDQATFLLVGEIRALQRVDVGGRAVADSYGLPGAFAPPLRVCVTAWLSWAYTWHGGTSFQATGLVPLSAARIVRSRTPAPCWLPPCLQCTRSALWMAL